ncbi:hypothetical protein NL676_009028 [Syzygium grande]|nr:hypothetical protein NL676_009028 [Syzygium grande]
MRSNSDSHGRRRCRRLLLLSLFPLFLGLPSRPSEAGASGGGGGGTPDGDAVGYGYTVRSAAIDPSGATLAAELRLINRTSIYGPDVENLRLVARSEQKHMSIYCLPS